MLPYIRDSHLVCIEKTMQSTPVCQWTFWRVTAGRMQEKAVFSPFLCVPAFAGKSLNGWHDTGEKRKGKVSKSCMQARKKRDLWQSASWYLEVVNGVVKYKGRMEGRTLITQHEIKSWGLLSWTVQWHINKGPERWQCKSYIFRGPTLWRGCEL